MEIRLTKGERKKQEGKRGDHIKVKMDGGTTIAMYFKHDILLVDSEVAALAIKATTMLVTNAHGLLGHSNEYDTRKMAAALG